MDGSYHAVRSEYAAGMWALLHVSKAQLPEQDRISAATDKVSLPGNILPTWVRSKLSLPCVLTSS